MQMDPLPDDEIDEDEWPPKGGQEEVLPLTQGRSSSSSSRALSGTWTEGQGLQVMKAAAHSQLHHRRRDFQPHNAGSRSRSGSNSSSDGRIPGGRLHLGFSQSYEGWHQQQLSGDLHAAASSLSEAGPPGPPRRPMPPAEPRRVEGAATARRRYARNADGSRGHSTAPATLMQSSTTSFDLSEDSAGDGLTLRPGCAETGFIGGPRRRPFSASPSVSTDARGTGSIGRPVGVQAQGSSSAVSSNPPSPRVTHGAHSSPAMAPKVAMPRHVSHIRKQVLMSRRLEEQGDLLTCNQTRRQRSVGAGHSASHATLITAHVGR